MSRPDLDLGSCASPEDLVRKLHDTADAYDADCLELGSAWQDENAGRIWRDAAVILRRTAASIETKIQERLG